MLLTQFSAWKLHDTEEGIKILQFNGHENELERKQLIFYLKMDECFAIENIRDFSR